MKRNLVDVNKPERQDQPDRRLDVSGTLCPIPVVRAREVLRAMTPGELLEVLATDPLAEMDLAVMCQHSGHELVLADASPEQVRVLIRVGQPARPAT